MLSLLKALPEWDIAGFYDDGVSPGTVIKSIPVLGGLDSIRSIHQNLNLILSLGDPKVKSRLVTALKSIQQLEFPVIIHPQAIIQDDDSVMLGDGCILTAGVILTTDIQLGDHVLLNLNCTVGHDVRIGDCSSIMPGVNIAGGVTIGKNVLVGSGASILNGITIGDDARIGSGAVVTRNVAPGKTVVGVPAVPIKPRS
jgi:sugar O-acyltransferase (sialic acid O-acetyltransferase NeuD family)